MEKFSNFKKYSRINEQEANDLYPQSLLQQRSQEQPNEQVTKSEPAKFFSKLFESREMAHMYHLQVRGDMGSHAAHTALNEYYEGVIEHIDGLVEIYQGQYDVVDDYDVIDTSVTKTKDKIEYFQELAKFIKDTRNMAILPEDTHLQNIIDEIVADVYHLLYKLRFNK